MEIRPPKVDHPEFPTNNAVMRPPHSVEDPPTLWPPPPPEILDRMIRPLNPMHPDQLKVGMEVAILNINLGWKLTTIADITIKKPDRPDGSIVATITRADGHIHGATYKFYPSNPSTWFYRVKMSKEESRGLAEIGYAKKLPYSVMSRVVRDLTGYYPKRAMPVQPPPPLTAEQQEERATWETLAAMKGGRGTKTSRRTRKQKRGRSVKRRGIRLGTHRVHRF